MKIKPILGYNQYIALSKTQVNNKKTDKPHMCMQLFTTTLIKNIFDFTGTGKEKIPIINR